MRTLTINPQPARKLLASLQLIALLDQETIATERQGIDYVGSKILSTLKTSKVTPAFRDLKQLNIEDARRWVKFWGNSRFIEPQRLRAML